MVSYTKKELNLIKDKLRVLQHLSKIEAFHEAMKALPLNRRKHARYAYDIDKGLEKWIIQEKIDLSHEGSYKKWDKTIQKYLVEDMVESLRGKDKNSWLLHDAFIKAQDKVLHLEKDKKKYISVGQFMQGKYKIGYFFQGVESANTEEETGEKEDIEIKENEGRVEDSELPYTPACNMPINDETVIRVMPKIWDDEDYEKFFDSFESWRKHKNFSFLELTMDSQRCLDKNKRKLITIALVKTNKRLKEEFKNRGISLNEKDYRRYQLNPTWSREECCALLNRTMQLLQTLEKGNFSSYQMQEAFMVSQASVLRSGRTCKDKIFSSFLQINCNTTVPVFIGRLRSRQFYDPPSAKKQEYVSTLTNEVAESGPYESFDSKEFAKSIVHDLKDILQPRIQEIINDVLSEIKESLRGELKQSIEQKLVVDNLIQRSLKVEEDEIETEHEHRKEKIPKRKILVLGPWAKFQRQVDLNLYPNLDIRFFDELKGVRQAMQPEPKEVTLIQATKFSAHLPKDIKTKIGDIRLMAGSLSHLRNQLQAINATVRDTNSVNM